MRMRDNAMQYHWDSKVKITYVTLNYTARYTWNEKELKALLLKNELKHKRLDGINYMIKRRTVVDEETQLAIDKLKEQQQ